MVENLVSKRGASKFVTWVAGWVYSAGSAVRTVGLKVALMVLTWVDEMEHCMVAMRDSTLVVH
jgi:hypothetical protein